MNTPLVFCRALCAAVVGVATFSVIGCTSEDTPPPPPVEEAVLPAVEEAATPEEVVQDLAATEIAKAIEADKDIVILDVRTPAEFAEGHLTGAKNIDFLAETFDAEIAKLDMAKTYVVHCRSGGRSSKSLEKFRAKGFVKILHMKDGFNGWTEAKLPVEK